jgi:hypothetical protein
MKDNKKNIKKDTKGVPFEVTLNVYYYIDDEGNYLLSDDDMVEQFDVKMGAIRQLFEDKNMKERGVWR